MVLDKINLDGNSVPTFNLSAIVGFAGANRKDEVMLILGLFNYIAQGLSPGTLGLDGDYKVPQISGEMDTETYSAIGEFQIRNAGSLLMKTYDNRIHPANYRSRRLHTAGGLRFISITLLHLLATDAAYMQGQIDYASGLASLNSALVSMIDGAFAAAVSAKIY